MCVGVSNPRYWFFEKKDIDKNPTKTEKTQSQYQ